MADVLEPSGETGWNLQKWQRTVEMATYQEMTFVPVIDEGDRPYGVLNIRKHARQLGSTLAQSSDGTGLNYLDIIGTPVTVTPVGSVVPIAWSQNLKSQLDLQIDAEARKNAEASLAELTETNALANVASGTQVYSAAGADAAGWRITLGRLAGNTNGMAMPGGKMQTYSIFSHTQYPNIAAIAEINAADVRGDSENPYVRGIMAKGFGCVVQLSSVITADANGWHQAVYLPSAFVSAWNEHSQLSTQQDELQYRTILYNNVGFSVKHDLRFIDFRSTVTAI